MGAMLLSHLWHVSGIEFVGVGVAVTNSHCVIVGELNPGLVQG